MICFSAKYRLLAMLGKGEIDQNVVSSAGFGPGEIYIPGRFGDFKNYLIFGYSDRSIAYRIIQVELVVRRGIDLKCLIDRLLCPRIERLCVDSPAVVPCGKEIDIPAGSVIYRDNE